MKTLKMQHGGWVNSVCALPDGRLLTGSEDKFARVFSDTGGRTFQDAARLALCIPSAPFRMGGCSPVPGTSLRACSRTLEPNFSRCSTAAMCGPVCALPDGRLLTGSDDSFARVFSDNRSRTFQDAARPLCAVRLRPFGWAAAHRFR